MVLTAKPITISAGIIVRARRANRGMRQFMNPAMTTCPAYVPTLEDDRPEAIRAIPNASAAPPPMRVAR